MLFSLKYAMTPAGYPGGEINIRSWRCESEIQEGDQPGRYLKVISMEIRMDTLTPKAVGSGIILTSAKAFTPPGVEVKQTNTNL